MSYMRNKSQEYARIKIIETMTDRVVCQWYMHDLSNMNHRVIVIVGHRSYHFQ